MEEDTRNPERAEDLLKILSVFVAMISFWVIALSWNYIFLDDLEFVPRLGLGAALSWVVFLHVEATGMIIMSMMREKWRSEGQAEVREARLEAAEARAREAQAHAETAEGRAREAQAHAEAAEAHAETSEARAEAARLEARAEAAEGRAREAQAKLEAQEVISDLRRQLREARGEAANGAEDA